jgi:DNA primase
MDDFKKAVEEIKLHADIVGIVSRRVDDLKRVGRNYKGCCPFHQEKTPSFHVLPDRNRFHCFGCGAGGTVVDFVMRIERLEFIDAIKLLSQETGIALPETRGAAKLDQAAREAQAAHARSVQGANDFALAWFRRNLLERASPLANDYMEGRGITAELAEKFQLGAAPDEWTALLDAAKRKGFTDSLLVDAGLAVRNEDSGRVYDRFRNRLVFPILDVQGRVIGFGGRRLDEDPRSPKYLNSAETEVYHKSRSLYALNWARESVVQSGFAILTEGYMDTITAHAHGFPQTVASLGTALTPEQAKLIRRFASRVYFLYDGDDAGQKAMLKGGEALLGAGLDAWVIRLDGKDDPDDFLRREGPAALRARIDDAVEFFDFALTARAAKLDLGSMYGKGELVAQLAPLLRAFQNEIQYEDALNRIQLHLGGVPRSAIVDFLGKSMRPAQPAPAAEREHVLAPTPIESYDSLERNLLKLMIENLEALEIVRRDLDPAWIHDPALEGWILFLLEGHHKPEVMIEEARELGELPADESVLNALWALDLPLGDPPHSAGQLITRLRRRHSQSITNGLLAALDRTHRDNPAELPLGALKAFHEEARLASRIMLPKGPHRIE